MRILFFLVLYSMLLSCTEKIIEKPEDLISKDKMVNIVYDLAIMTAAKNISPTVLEDYHIETMNYLFTKYKIDSVQFVRSDLYYASIPTEYLAIYKKVDSRLEKEQKKLEEARKRINDSTKQVMEKGSRTIVPKINGDSLP